MRRSVLALATVVALLIVGAPLRADDLVFTLFGAYLEALRTQSGMPGLSAAIVGDTDIIWERALGQQDVDRNVAMRSDTLFQVDGVTQVVSSAMILRCVEEGRLSLDDRVGQYLPKSPDANATLRQILTHTSGPADNLVFAYHPERLAQLAPIIRKCTINSYRETLATELEQLAMMDSVPGADEVDQLHPPSEGVPTPDQVARYTDVLQRLATPYAVDAKGHASPSQYTTTTVTPGGGLISTTRDLAKFDLALRQGILVQPDTLAASWQPPVGAQRTASAARHRLVRAAVQEARRSCGSSAWRRMRRLLS